MQNVLQKKKNPPQIPETIVDQPKEKNLTPSVSTQPKISTTPQAATQPVFSKASKKERAVKSLKSSKITISFLKKYLRHFPLLFMSIFCYAVCVYILTHIDPEKLQNFLIPNTYLPFLCITALANFLFFSFLFLNTRRGIFAAIFLTLILFLKLQQVLTTSIFFSSFFVFFILEFILTFIERAG
jgi:hypothetical protein